MTVRSCWHPSVGLRAGRRWSARSRRSPGWRRSGWPPAGCHGGRGGPVVAPVEHGAVDVGGGAGELLQHDLGDTRAAGNQRGDGGSRSHRVAVEHLAEGEERQRLGELDLLPGERRPIAGIGGAVQVEHRCRRRNLAAASQHLAVVPCLLRIERLAHGGEALKAGARSELSNCQTMPPPLENPAAYNRFGSALTVGTVADPVAKAGW